MLKVIMGFNSLNSLKSLLRLNSLLTVTSHIRLKNKNKAILPGYYGMEYIIPFQKGGMRTE